MSTCTRCGAAFACAVADGADGPCWCMSMPPLAALLQGGGACWCPACLRAELERKQAAPPAELRSPAR